MSSASDSLRVEWQDGDRLFCRGSRLGTDGNRNAVLVVLLAAEHPPPASLDRLSHEYELKDEMDGAWAVRPLELGCEGGRTMLVLEDPGGEPLERLLGAPMEVESFLHLAIGIATALGKVHQRGFVHKDVKPANILVNCTNKQVRLTGFGIASRLPSERQAPEPPEIIAGTLAYMAPEQTGRMNRSIDTRSDLYALGVVLYQMLTGSLPFTASDPMEWVHCHIARQPVPPVERLREVPGALSAIIMKLLAKVAEERYQTAAGLERDLWRCLAQWEAERRIDDFPLGERDMPDRLRIPEKLYGRATEINALTTSFDRVVASGTPELVLISGYSGVGKSSVVNELHMVLVPPRGLFASGKFDQYKRDIPYATLAQAFQGLIRPLLGWSEAELAGWRDALREALGPNAKLMVDLVPELKLITGEPPPVPELPPQQAQSRFQLVFRRLLGVFAQPEHPLALFLDDLQWLDPATLDLLEDLLTEPEVRHLLLIGAYRDNEVMAGHPLLRKLDAIRQAGARLQEISLAPLARVDVQQLIADALRCGPEEAAPLAQLVHEKTGGNPFFAIQFLHALDDESLLSFDHDAGHWQWDLNRIHAKGYTDNVVDLMAGKLTRLPTETQTVLQLFACLGNVAEIGTLCLIRGTSEQAVHADLWEAVRKELILQREGVYQFVHDRVQEAAYSLIPADLRAAAHLRIGRLLAAHTPPEKRDEAIFEIVNQLNRSAALITSRDEREQLAEFNLIAGKRAKLSTAYASALIYLVAGAALLAEDAWKHQHELIFALELERGECEFLTGALAEAERRLAALSIRAANTVERATVACLRADLYVTLDQSSRAIAVGLDYLRHLGIDWSPHPTEEEARQEYERIWSHLGSRTIEALIELPLMNDPAPLATMDVLTKLIVPALLTDANLLALVTCRAVNLSLERGNCDASCAAYAFLGIVAGPRFGAYQEAYRFGRLGYDLVEGRGLTRFQARVYMDFGNVVLPWTRHVRAGRDFLRRAVEAANKVGDITYAAYCGNQLNTNFLAAGDPLAEVQREAEHGLAFAQKARFGFVIDLIATQLGLIRTLRGLTPTFGSFDDAQFDERQIEHRFSENPDLAFGECWYWVRKLQARFFAGDYASAIEAASRAQQLLWTSPSYFEKAEYYFYSALSHAACCDAASADRQQHLDAVAALHRELQLWAANCPDNFENRAALVGAEMARLDGRELDAMRLYELAIHSARANGFVHNEALGHELAARFYAARGFEKFARVYLQDARYGYLRWGADGKVQQLDQLYPELRQDERAPGPAGTIGASIEHLELATVLKVSQAVSDEIEPEKLIDTLLRTAVEHAGAQRGLLIVPEGAELRIQAEVTSGGSSVTIDLRNALVSGNKLAESVVRYAARTQESVILDDASARGSFSSDDYIRREHARSVLCLPLMKQGKPVALLYLENNLAPRVFTPARIAVLRLLASEAATSLEISRLYRELQEREAKIRRLVDANIVGIFIWDVEGQISEANDAFLRIVGYEREDLVSGRMRWTDLTPPEWLDRDTQQWLPKLKTTGTLQPIEKEYFRKDGSRVPVLLGAATFEEGGRQGVAFVLELTERKAAEAERAARRAAEAANEAKNAFLANMSHELRTPLNGILGYAQILRRNKTLGERDMEGLNVIQHSGEQLLTLINDILDFAKIEAGKLELSLADLDLAKFLRMIAEIINVRAVQKGLDFICDLAPDLPDGIRVDESRLRQVLLNLLTNAVKFTDRGQVTLRVRFSPPSRLRFEVLDTGIGVSANQLETIFQPFEQVSDPQRRLGGAGLGLAISRQFVRLMDGEIHVTSEVGAGSTFWFELEVPVIEVATIALPERLVTGYEGPRKKVLVVDDVAANRAMAIDMVSQLGFDVVEAASGAQALDQARATRPDWILMDIVMPEMDGLEATRRLRQLPGLEGVPIIATSASASGSDAQKCLAAGVNAFVPKPIDLEQLLIQIASLLKLNWIYAPQAAFSANEEAAGLLVAPPEQELERLHQLARLGNMRDILQWAEQVAELDACYRPFADQLRLLAKGYQSKAILTLVERHLECRPGV